MKLAKYFVVTALFLKSILSYPGLNSNIKPNLTCLQEIAKTYFTEKRINIFQESLHNESYQDDIIKLFNNWTVEVFNEEMSVTNEHDIHILKSKIKLFLLTSLENDKIVEKLKKFRANPTWNSRSKILVILKTHDQVRLVLKTLWDIAKAVNVVITTNCQNFYTWKPYQKHDCNEVKEISIIKFSELFSPIDYSNLNQCNILIQSTFIPPYVLAWNRNTSQYVGGIEIQILNNLAAHINFKPMYLPLQLGFHAWITRNPNGTIDGALKLLMEYKADLAFSTLRLNFDRFMNSDALITYMEDEIVWFVPTPRIKPPVASMMYSLHKYIWAGIATCVLMSSILLYFKEPSPSFIYLFLKITAAFLNTPIKTKTRLPLVLAYIAALHTVTSFNSWMSVNLMKNMTDKPIQNLQEIADKNLNVYLLPSLTRYYNQSDFAAWDKILRSGKVAYNALFYYTLDEIAYNKTGALLFPKLPALYYIGNNLLDENGQPKVIYLKPRFLSSKLSFFLAPGHPLTPLFNKKMEQLIESGLINFWLSNYINHSAITSNRINYQEGSGPLKPLTIKNISPGIFYWAVLNMLSFVIFLGELIYGFRQKRKLKKILAIKMILLESEFKYLN